MTSPASPSPGRRAAVPTTAASRVVRWSPPRPATAARVVPVVLLAMVAPWVAAALGFIGLVEWTGCFIGCNDTGNEPLGAALVAGALAALATPPAVAWGLLRSGAAVGWALAGMVVAFVVPGLFVFRIAGAATIGG